MLSTRLAMGLSLVAVLLLILGLDEYLAPWFPLWFAASMFVMGSCAQELVSLLKHTSAKPAGNTVFGGAIALVIANWAPHIVEYWAKSDPNRISNDFELAASLHVMAWPFWAFAAIVMLAFVVESIQFEKPGQTMATIAGTVLAVAYVGVLGSFIIQMRWFDGPYHGLPLLALLVATAKGADTGAYTFGRLFGKHKLWPKLSPNKTIEGALGGLLFGVLAAILVTAVTRYLLKSPCLTWGGAVGFGLIVGPVAQLGDLMESMIKRDCVQKDASSAVPGFGGVLDVLDSLLFAGPVAYGYWIWIGPN